MTIQPISPTTTLLYLTQTQLQEQGLHPDFLTDAQAAELAREGLSSLGRSADSVLELECYPGKGGLLLFIHTAPAVWRFPDGNALLDAVAALHHLVEQPLYWWKGAFWLVAEGSAPLSEFADPVRGDPFLSARLAEYAQPLS